jgi:hypothetical protein
LAFHLPGVIPVPSFELRQSSQIITGRAGHALVGKALERFAGMTRAVDPRFPVRSGVPTSDVMKSYVGLLCEGKSDFDAIESKRRDPVFPLALKLRQVPSSPTLRQRLDDLGMRGAEAIDALTVPLLVRGKAPITGLDTGHALELREGDRHSAHETEYTLERVIPRAAALTRRPLLLRWDAGFDSERLYCAALNQAAAAGAALDVLSKWNPRVTPVEDIALAKCAARDTAWRELRPGKRETVWVEAGRTLTLADGTTRTLRRVLRLTERRTDPTGQPLLFPNYALDGWETTLERCLLACQGSRGRLQHIVSRRFGDPWARTSPEPWPCAFASQGQLLSTQR